MVMRIIFNIPGRTFSNHFLVSWTNVLSWCNENGIEVILSNRYTSNVYYVRSMCLGGNVLSGIHQKPWQGKIDYDYMMWIDSDIVFTPQDIQKLLYANKDIVAGMYKMTGGQQYAIVRNWDEQRYLSNGSFEFLSDDTIPKNQRYLEVSYSGMGFMLVKKGVFESLEYPWFKPVSYIMANGIEEFASEDVSWCQRIINKGYKIYIDTQCKIGHEKTFIY
jgi:hypothetical protein